MKRLLATTAVLLFAFAATASAAVIAQEDFDGGDINLIGSVVPALDGGGGDWFGVGSRNAWPQGFPIPGVPFSLGDDSVIDYSGAGMFAGDLEGVFGENSDFDNKWFGISDSDEFGADQTASWTFNITSGTNLSVCIDMGGVSDANFGGYSLATTVVFTAQIDAGPVQTLFSLSAIDNPGFVSRNMDSGVPGGGGRVLVASGDNAVTKLLAETGAPAGNQYLDKTPPSGAGAGRMDTYSTDLNGTGSTLVITLTADFPFEAMAFDNIVVKGDGATPTQQSSWGRLKKLYR